MHPQDLAALHLLALSANGQLKRREIIELASKTEYDRFQELGDFTRSLVDLRLGMEHPLLSEKDWNEALRTFERSANEDIHCIPITSPSYPAALRAIDDPPAILYLRGEMSILEDIPGIAIVGTRKMTPNGAIITRRISQFMSENGWVVVSGLAIGIDAEAHRGCLDVGGKTIAVLAHGLEKPQPARNAKLGYEILEKGGAWVSEYPIGTSARPAQFVARNRIQLGLSAGSIIVECEPKSGSITQAQFCIKQGRPLFAVVPHLEGNPLQLLSSGTDHLVKNFNAIPVKTKEDYPFVLETISKQRQLMLSLS